MYPNSQYGGFQGYDNQFNTNQFQGNMGHDNQGQMNPGQFQTQGQNFNEPANATPKPRLIVKMENNERGFYSTMLLQVDPSDKGRVEASSAVPFFRRSGLAKDVLRNIWLIASTNNESLDREEFYVAMRLVAYAQNNIEVSAESIQQNIKVPLPKFEPAPQKAQQEKKPTLQEMADNMAGVDYLAQSQLQNPNQQGGQQNFNTQSAGNSGFIGTSTEKDDGPDDGIVDIGPELLKQYELIFDTFDAKKKGLMTKLEAKDTFMKSGLPTNILFQIWSLADSGDRGYLDKAEFILALHFIAVAKKGIVIPKGLSKKFERFLKEYKKRLPSKDLLITKLTTGVETKPQPPTMDNSFQTQSSEGNQPRQNQSVSSRNNLDLMDMGLESNRNGPQQQQPNRPSMDQPQKPIGGSGGLQGEINSTLSFMGNTNAGIIQKSVDELRGLEDILQHYQGTLRKIREENKNLEERLKEINAKKGAVMGSIVQTQNDINSELSRQANLQQELHSKMNNQPTNQNIKPLQQSPNFAQPNRQSMPQNNNPQQKGNNPQAGGFGDTDFSKDFGNGWVDFENDFGKGQSGGFGSGF